MSGRPWADCVLAQTAPPSITRASSQSLVGLIAVLLCCPNDCSLRPAPRQSGRPRLSCAAAEDSTMILSAARAGAFKDIPRGGNGTNPSSRSRFSSRDPFGRALHTAVGAGGPPHRSEEHTSEL